MIAAAATSAVLSFCFLDKVYEASTTLILSSKRGIEQTVSTQVDAIRLYQQLVNTYGVIAKSNHVMKQVIENLNLDMTIVELRKKITVEPEQDTGVIRITVEHTDPKLAQDIANTLSESFKKRVVELLDLDNVNTVDAAEMPDEPVRPKPVFNILVSLFSSLILGLGIILLVEYLDNTIKTPDDVENHLRLSVLGTIPFYKVKNSENGRSKGRDVIKAAVWEAYKTVRTNIQFSVLDKPLKVIMVTSAVPGEGKSTTVVNLAVSMAQASKKVLLLDCDLRNSKIHTYLNTSNLEGLTSILSGMGELSTVLKETHIPNLKVITSGIRPPNPSELLGTEKMKAFLEEAKKEFDIILMDAPPVLLVTDALVLAGIVDGVLMVTRSHQSVYEKTKRALESIRKTGARILGVVLNAMQDKGYKAYHYYYHDYL